MDFLHVYKMQRCSIIIGESMHTKTLKLGSFNEKPASTIGVFFFQDASSQKTTQSALGVSPHLQCQCRKSHISSIF